MLKQSLMGAFEELLDERSTLKSKLAANDSLIDEQMKENEVNAYSQMSIHNTYYIYI